MPEHLERIQRGALWAGRGNMLYLMGCVLADSVTRGEVPLAAYEVGLGAAALSCTTYFGSELLERWHHDR